MGLCICRGWISKQSSSFTPQRDPSLISPSTQQPPPSSTSPSTSTVTVPPVQPTCNPQRSDVMNSLIINPSIEDNNGQEISYNKISVREPLSRVLAERAILENHHYNEIDNNSNDETDDITDPGYEVVDFKDEESEPCYATIGKSLNNSISDEVESMVGGINKPGKRQESCEEDGESAFSVADPGYEVVKFNQTSEPFYAVIGQGVSHSNDNNRPEPVNDTKFPVPENPSTALVDLEDYSSPDPVYEVIFKSPSIEPCYAVIDVDGHKESEPINLSVGKPEETLEDPDDEDDFSLADPGYEALKVNNNTKADPVYAVINKGRSNPRFDQINQIESEPCYAVVDKRANGNQIVSNQLSNAVECESNSNCDENYSAADPGYEVVKPINQLDPQTEPCYAVINKSSKTSGKG